MTAAHYVRQGNERLGVGDLNTALACFEAALRLDAQDADAHFGRGFVKYQIGDNATAFAELTESIRLAPEAPGSAAAYAMRTAARANLGDRRGAMNDAREAVSRNPEILQLLQSMTCVGTAQIVVLAQAYPAQLAMIVDLLTRAEL